MALRGASNVKYRSSSEQDWPVASYGFGRGQILLAISANKLQRSLPFVSAFLHLSNVGDAAIRKRDLLPFVQVERSSSLRKKNE